MVTISTTQPICPNIARKQQHKAPTSEISQRLAGDPALRLPSSVEIGSDGKSDRDFLSRIGLPISWALLYKSADGRTAPTPGQTYPIAFVKGMPGVE